MESSSIHRRHCCPHRDLFGFSSEHVMSAYSLFDFFIKINELPVTTETASLFWILGFVLLSLVRVVSLHRSPSQSIFGTTIQDHYRKHYQRVLKKAGERSSIFSISDTLGPDRKTFIFYLCLKQNTQFLVCGFHDLNNLQGHLNCTSIVETWEIWARDNHTSLDWATSEWSMWRITYDDTSWTTCIDGCNPTSEVDCGISTMGTRLHPTRLHPTEDKQTSQNNSLFSLNTDHKLGRWQWSCRARMELLNCQ